MKKIGTYKGYTIIQYGRTHRQFSATTKKGPSMYQGKETKYDTLDELHAFIDRRERCIQSIMADAE